MKYKYKIKSWKNDLGETVYHPYKKDGLVYTLHWGTVQAICFMLRIC